MNIERVYKKITVRYILDHGKKIKTPVGPFFFISDHHKKSFIIVKKKIGNAVKRNYVKRFYREVIRSAVHQSEVSVSFVLFHKSADAENIRNLILIFKKILLMENGKKDVNGKDGL